MTFTKNQRDQIKGILEQKLREKIGTFVEQEDMNKPFYFSLFSEEIVFSASLLQSIYTWLGGKWEEISHIIAHGSFQQVEKRYQLHGEITSKEQAKIDDILKDLETGVTTPNIKRTKQELLRSYNPRDSTRKAFQTVDLALMDNTNEIYLELKSVKPNKNEMRAAKQDLLNILAMRQKVKDTNQVSTYLALPFNPYFSGEYRRWTVTKFFRNRDDLLVGKDYWDFIGGEGTYEDILNVFSEVGAEATSLMHQTISKLKADSPPTRIDNFTE